MKKILVLYPKLFNCYQKFHRKVEKILSASDAVELVYPSDENGFIQRISDESQKVNSTQRCENWSVNDVTHAIVFDDGEEFPKEVELLKENSVPLRLIDVSITRVINIKREPEYKGLKVRPSTSTLGGDCIGETLIQCMKTVKIEKRSLESTSTILILRNSQIRRKKRCTSLLGSVWGVSVSQIRVTGTCWQTF